MKRFTGHTEPWSSFVDVKYCKPIVHKEKYQGKELFIGSVTDPYQPLEQTFCRTRKLLEEVQGSGCKISISTKSDLVLRDIDLIRSFKDARVSWSINTLDEAFRKDMDHAATIEKRFAAMEAFYKAGIRTTCFISPIFPEITDVKAIIERAKDKCNLIWLENLNLRGDYKHVILQYIREKFPHLVSLYEDIYNNKDRTYWKMLDEDIRQYCEANQLPYVRNDDSLLRGFDEPPAVVNYFYHEEIIPSAQRKRG